MVGKLDNKQAAYAVDWIRGTIVVNATAQSDVRNRLQELFGEVRWERAASIPFSYNEGVDCDFAGVYWNTEHPEFGLMLDMSGSRLSALRDAGISDQYVIEGAHLQGWKFTRIDIAMDVYNTGARPKDMYAAWQGGALRTKARTAGIYQTRNQAGVKGETVYFGSRTSDVYLRVYDKAKEQNQTGDRIRVEFEVKHDRANAVAMSVLDQGVPRTIAALITDQILAGVPQWMRSAMELEFTIVKVEASKDTNFEKWFSGTVLPAIEKAIRINMPDVEMLINRAIKSGKSGHGG
jgi:hypothetical protein